MANPSTLTKYPALIAAATDQSSVAVDSDYDYSIQHTGLDVSSAADTNTVYLAVERVGDTTTPTITATMAAADNKHALLAGASVVLGPGVKVIHFKTAAGAPVMNLATKGAYLGGY